MQLLWWQKVNIGWVLLVHILPPMRQHLASKATHTKCNRTLIVAATKYWRMTHLMIPVSPAAIHFRCAIPQVKEGMHTNWQHCLLWTRSCCTACQPQKNTKQKQQCQHPAVVGSQHD